MRPSLPLSASLAYICLFSSVFRALPRCLTCDSHHELKCCMSGAYAAGVYAGPCDPCSSCIFPPEIAVHVHLSCPSVVMISSRHNNDRATPVARRLLRTHRHRPSRFGSRWEEFALCVRGPEREGARCLNAHARTHGPLCPFRRLATYSTALSVHSRSFGCWGVQFQRGLNSISNIITSESVER